MKTKTAKLRVGGHRADSRSRFTYAVVSQEDHARLSRFKWSIHSNGYAYRLVQGDDRRSIVYLHREVMQLQPGHGVVDHINGNPLDCRRENLRVLQSNAHNLQNRRSGSGSSTYRGVYRNKKNQRWIAQIRQDGKTLYGGSFEQEREAAFSAELLRRLHMPYARPDSRLQQELGDGLDAALASWEKQQAVSS